MIQAKTKILCLILTAFLAISAFSLTAIGISAATASGITEEGGWLESCYAEWTDVEGADGYNVYVTRNGSTDWRRIDDMLIRKYSNYWRADVVGLKAGRYKIKIVPKKGATELSDKALITSPLKVLAHDRSGYAFDGGTASGAYNDDGTLKSDAQVVYVTASNAKTCTATVNGQSYEGFQTILDAKQKQGTNEPICFRIVGLVTLDDLDHISSDSEGIQIKGKKSYTEMNITIEGVGEDATVSGFGFLIRNCKNVEIRNIGIMNFIDDGISVDTDNSNLWVHNCDFFYGSEGGDSDQAKGDGSLDTKKSQNITYSYNHFFDSGKVHLVGNGSSDSVNYLTFHHNWYDHADSRMPRVRSATVHVYNNFYDGVSKYGIGSTLGSDIFSEANYFLNTKHPMLISKQGSDIAESSKGTFSGENGGIIKSFGDVMVDCGAFVSYQQNGTQFDAYVASSRNEKLSSSVKAVAGGATYSNFDTDSDFYSYNPQTAEDAMNTVKQYAGRVNGGDFKWSFTSADNSDYDVNTSLKNALTKYKSSVVSIGGVGDGFISDNDYHTGYEDEPHVHEYEEKLTKEATCTEEGILTYTCECGESYTEVVSKKNHSFDKGACTVCGAEDPDYIPPHTHSWSDATCTQPQKCVCGETKGTATGHSFLNGICSVCGAEDPDYVKPDDPEVPHVHSFVNGKCECGAEDPNYTPDNEIPDTENPDSEDNQDGTQSPENPENPDDVQPEEDKPEDNQPEKLNFFQRIFRAIANFFRKLFGIKKD